jgi:hypothetical protein
MLEFSLRTNFHYDGNVNKKTENFQIFRDLERLFIMQKFLAKKLKTLN